MVLYALHDAMVRPMPGNVQVPCLAQSWCRASGVSNRRHMLLDQPLIGAAIALERELDVLGGDRIAIVEFDAITQHLVPG